MREETMTRAGRLRRLLWIAALVSVIAATVAVQRAAATQDSSDPPEDDIIVVHHSDELPGALRVVESGAFANGECVIAGHLEGSGGNPGAIIQRTVEVNLTTCQITYERLEIPLSDLHLYDDSVPSGGMSESESATVEVASPGDSQFPPANTNLAASVTHYIGSIKVNVEDPIDIDVTTTKSTIRWRQEAGSSCLAGANFDAHWGWYSPSGWHRDTASWEHDFSCTSATMNTYGTYSNSSFCPWPWGTTYTDHFDTYYEGSLNGGWYVSWDVDISGGCGSWLDKEHIIVHP